MAKPDYVPSINILRDEYREIFYIPTPNGNRVVSQIINDFRRGLRVFNLIGSYGTGKSSFLLALDQSFSANKPYFNTEFFSKSSYQSIKIVGEFKSIVSVFAARFGLSVNDETGTHIFQELFNSYHDLGAESPFLLIIIDEFGQFLEYAAQNNSESDLYFIQQLAEFVGNPDRRIVLITTIHQSFESYAFGLNKSARQEWTKVKGRFKDITFNEPIEQLLFLAAEHIGQLYRAVVSKKMLELSFDLYRKAKFFAVDEKYGHVIHEKIYPLDITAANLLTIGLQRYGQNERSLFSFLESTDHTGLLRFNTNESAFYNICNVFDYLNFNFYSFLSSKYNTDFAAWSSIKATLETVERAYDSNINDLQKIIKIIGLLNIFSSSGANINFDFIESYSKNIAGIENSGELLRSLESKKIIRYRSHSDRFVLYEGTDLDIQTALIEAANKVSEITDVPTLLKKHFDFTPVLTKAYSFETGTPRYFKYLFSEVPVEQEIEQDIDGYVNLIFSDYTDFEEVRQFSESVEDAILYGYYRNAKEIKHLLYEIEKTQQVLKENKEDRIASRELDNILISQQNLLKHYILNNLFEQGGVRWAWQGQELMVESKRMFNRHLSQICTQTYSGTPIFRNELVNRPKLSGSIFAAKKNYFAALTSNWNKPDLGFESSKFPPEKTIYLTLIRQNGISTDESSGLNSVAADSSFYPLWYISNEFLESCKQNRRNISEFCNLLKARPFRLKQGFIDFWVPTFLFLRRNDFALFGTDGFIPEQNADILDLLSKSPKDYWVKTFDIEGVKLDVFNSYRIFLNQQLESHISNQSFIETIKPFLVFYRQLPEYSKYTKRLSKEGLAIRSAISSSRDPEKSFFEDFPAALGFNISQLQETDGALNNFTSSLQAAIKEIRTSYENLVNRIDDFIKEDIIGREVDFDEYKKVLSKRFSSLKRHLLLPHQKAFIQRIDSALDDKRAWLVSICQAVTGKSLENFRDEDEVTLYDKIGKLIFELDSLTKLSKVDIDESQEDVLGIRVDSFNQGSINNFIRVPKNKAKIVTAVKLDIRQKLSHDNIVNIAALTQLLKELTDK
jgi:hypothetical protein